MKTFLLTITALLAFAGNSILCRYALKGDAIDAASFTSIRLLSGAVVLFILLAVKSKFAVTYNKSTVTSGGGAWLSAFYLFIYALTFSFAYISLDTGAGALILFGAVQVTMVLMNLLKGKALLRIEWIGLFVAFSGLVILLLPSASAPSIGGFLLMAISGIAWGGYTLAGKGAANPLALTTSNFLKALPFVVLLSIFTFDSIEITSHGLLLAIVSGALTSGIGYAIWYSALGGLSVMQASVLQLTVPIIATFGGVVFSHEAITGQLLISSLFVLSGIMIVTVAKRQ